MKNKAENEETEKTTENYEIIPMDELFIAEKKRQEKLAKEGNA